MSANRNIPLFLIKLWKMVNDPDNDNEVCWNESGKSFIINNQAQFCCEILPQYYKHNNMSSFVRQLNMYGFHKMASTENGTLNGYKSKIEFFHPDFQKDRPKLLSKIKRKVLQPRLSNGNSEVDNNVNLTDVQSEIQQIQEHDQNRDSQLLALKRENAVLWKELKALKESYLKQSTILNNLVHFIMTFVQKQMNDAKRRYQLQPNDLPNKQTKASNSKRNSDLGRAIQQLAVIPQIYGSNEELNEDSQDSSSVTENNVFNTLVSWQKSSSISDDELIEEDEDDFIPITVKDNPLVDEESKGNPFLIEAVTNNDKKTSSDSNTQLEFLNILASNNNHDIDEEMNMPIMDDPMISGYQVNSNGLDELLEDSNEDQTNNISMLFDFNGK